jgi:fumarate reductase flavoprotein subunit
MVREFDVIVVGAGGSGLAAAYSAAEHGGSVLVLEKRPQPGGTTGIAVGSFTAAGTALQQAAEIDDDADAHAVDVCQFAPPELESCNRQELRAFFLGEAAETYRWLEDLGLTFVGPFPEPPNRQPRMHNVVPGAKAYVTALQLALTKQGGKLQCGADVEELLCENQRTVGVRATVNGKSHEFRARRGVVLATGDYASNSELIARHKGAQFRGIEGINPFSTGEGHELVRAAGGQLVNMDITYGPELRFVASNRRPFQQWLPTHGWQARAMGWLAPRLPARVKDHLIKRLLVTWQHPEAALFDDGAILLNQHGARFVNERLTPTREIAVAAQPDKAAYLLLDGRLVKRYSAWPHFISTAPDIAYAYVSDYQRLRRDVTVTGYGISDVALRRGLDEAAVTKSVSDFNAYVTGSRDDSFGRQGDPIPLQDEPWVLLGPVKAYFTTTEGSAVINQQLQVLDERGEPISGLYAVGQIGLGGMILWGHGLHIAWAMTSGRLVGKLLMAAPV